MRIETGFYKHFKGGLYEVVGTAKHSETLEEYVVYKHMDDGSLWIRPAAMFLETIVRDGKKIKRFEKVSK
ncbi:MAG: DUF1653 domain-containing protein [Patescibacteria group bacterium]